MDAGHIEPDSVRASARVELLRPGTVIVTRPQRQYDVHFAGDLRAAGSRPPDVLLPRRLPLSVGLGPAGGRGDRCRAAPGADRGPADAQDGATGLAGLGAQGISATDGMSDPTDLHLPPARFDAGGR